MKSATNVVTALKRARALIARKNGWIQNDYSKKVGRTQAYCALGALGKVASGTVYLDARSFLSGSLLSSSAIATWNDTPGRTQKQVIRAFDRAIARAEKQAQKVEKAK